VSTTHKLLLKIGMPVIILRNFDRRANVSNGTKAIITRITPNALKVRLFAAAVAVDR
jgi:hypothetical protein